MEREMTGKTKKTEKPATEARDVGGLTKDKLLRRGEDVYTIRDFHLVDLELHPLAKLFEGRHDVVNSGRRYTCDGFGSYRLVSSPWSQIRRLVASSRLIIKS